MPTRTRNHDWLALTVEDPLDPELPICDPHHHLWDLRPERIAPRYLLDEIVDAVSASYTVLWNSFKRLTPGCSAEEKAKLFHDTAARVYRLPG